jgi:hypothetical protein
LNYSSKITNDIKKVLRKKAPFLEFETVEFLNATLNLLNPPLTQNINVTYYCKPVDEGKQKFISSPILQKPQPYSSFNNGVNRIVQVQERTRKREKITPMYTD